MNSSLCEQRGRFLHAGELTRGPWDPEAQHGGPPAALLMRAFEGRWHCGSRERRLPPVV